MKTITSKQIAERLKKSIWWVYANAGKLGGAKIAGSWIFTEEGLKDAIQRAQEMARSSEVERSAVYGGKRVKERGFRMGKQNKKLIEEEREDIARRAGLAEFL